MLTVSRFVGSFLQGLTKSRTMADGSSHRIAQQYLKHDLLRSFPVPRMTLKQVELEMNFCVAPSTRLETLLREPEILKNVAYRFHELFSNLPQNELFKAQFRANAPAPDRWAQGVADLESTLQRIVAASVSSRELLVHTLAVAIENFFHELHDNSPGTNFLSSLRELFSRQTPVPQATPPAPAADANTIYGWAQQQVTAILAVAIPPTDEDDETPGELSIMVGSGELEGKDSAKFQKAKLTFASEDRKWIASEKNGEKTYILSH